MGRDTLQLIADDACCEQALVNLLLTGVAREAVRPSPGLEPRLFVPPRRV